MWKYIEAVLYRPELVPTRDDSETNRQPFYHQCDATCLLHLPGQESFMTPRAVLSLALFNGFRVLGHKSEDPEELRLFVETMAFKWEA